MTQSSYRLRPYDAGTDRDALWALKRQFERGIGTDTGGDEKARTYERKLTDEYRERYLEWVDRCVAESPTVVTVAEVAGERDRGADGRSANDDDSPLVGYVFLLPESLAMIWDGAVLNELFVAEDHRGTGVADELLDTTLTVASEQDLPIDRLLLDVDGENDRARAFYRRYGFEQWGGMVCRPLE